MRALPKHIEGPISKLRGTSDKSLQYRPQGGSDQKCRMNYERLKQTASRMIRTEIKKHKVTGLSVALVDNQEIILAQGFGYADKKNNVLATPETIYRVGHIANLFTDILAMQLAEEGKIDIDKPLQDFLPEFSIKTRFPDAGPITARNIMTHHSGLPDAWHPGTYNEHPEPFTEVVTRIKDDFVAYPPNFMLTYSVLGATLLGHAIERITGTDFATRAHRSLLHPLGMTNSIFTTSPTGPGMAKAYRSGIEVTEKPLRDIPACGLNSNVLDLIRFIQMMFAGGQKNGNQLLKPETLAAMLCPQNTDVALDNGYLIGLGWMINDNVKNAGPVAQHDGETMFYRSQLTVLPDHKLGIVLLANSPSAGRFLSRLAEDLLAIALEEKTGRKQPESRSPHKEPTPISDKQIQDYVGHYATAAGYAKITRRGRRLQVEALGKRFSLVPRRDEKLELRYKLFGLIPLPLNRLVGLHLQYARIGTHEVLLGSSKGKMIVFAQKITPAELPKQLMGLIGEYEIINCAGDSIKFNKVGLGYHEGFLVITISSPLFIGGSVSAPIAAISNTEAIILGLGRGKQETIRLINEDGVDYVTFGGYKLRKKCR